MVEIRYRGQLITWIGGLKVKLDDGEEVLLAKHPGHIWEPTIEGEDACSQCGRTDKHTVYRIDGEFVDKDSIDLP